jgi:hypothetical protein
MTPICRVPQSVESPKRIDKKPEFSAKTVAFVSCRNRLTLILAGAASW